MDKNKIKSFAVWARRSLIGAIREKAHRIGIYEDKIIEATAIQGGFKLEGKEEIFHLSKSHRDALVNQVKEKGFEQVMEEVAYTWFNRFMGLRYMEVNDYLPSGIRILSSEVEGKKEPDALTRVSEIIDELNLNANEIYYLLDSGNTLDREKAYRIILVKQCNELGKIIPQMFEKISDYTELLLPDNLLEEGSVIRKMVEDIEESDWLEEVEIIGWMYQYYISEKKDEVFAGLKKNVKITKDNIPAATQLFTPKWIVKYMVENSLGRLWLEGHPNEDLQKEWKYYLEEAEQEPEVQEELQKIREEHSKLTPEDIKVLDPCMGSGHILVYAFDVLYEIYKTAGYSEREIPRLILQNNIYGLDIDDRAAQLASFALIMKARHYNRRLFREIEREHLELNLCSIQESNSIGREEIDYFCTLGKGKDNEEIRSAMEYLCEVFTDAKEYGSILEVKKINFEVLKDRLLELELEDDLIFADYRNTLLEKLPFLIKQANIMSRKYEACLTNPPYMGNKGMSDLLTEYIKVKYPLSKMDFYTVFIEKCKELTKKRMFYTLITQPTWLFLSNFEELRKSIISNSTIDSLLHLGRGIFGIDFGSSATVIRNLNIKGYYGQYFRLHQRTFKYIDLNEIEKIFLCAKNTNDYKHDFSIYNNKSKDIECEESLALSGEIIVDNIIKVKNIYCQDFFKSIPGNSIAYWVSDKFRNIFTLGNTLGDSERPVEGIKTGNNERFLKFWYEIDINEFGMYHLNKNVKWVPITKGGSFRKWYGNNEYVLYWLNNGNEVKSYPKSTVSNIDLFSLPAITWGYISSYKLSTRFLGKGYLYNNKGPACYFLNKENLYYVLALMNCKVIEEVMKFLAPTLDFKPGNIKKVPVIKVNNTNINLKIEEFCKENIELSKTEWNRFENSWDFKVHPLLKLLDKEKQYKISSIFNIWETECEEAFNQLKYNEEELNRIFIYIYCLQDELNPEVEDKDVTIRKADRERDIKSFISYGVGCILGRYSIDAEGLIYAGGDFNDKWNITDKKVRKIEKDDNGNIISDTWIDSRFMPDSDNIIPITEDEYFEDDIVSRFIDFVRTVYGNDTLEENLDFIADSIARKSSETSRQAIRRYFIKDFYKDHLKVYQKRPIYWMFESGKNDGFRCLIYMHRYNDQTVAKVRTDYLHTLQRKYEAEINRLQLVVDSEEHTAKDRNAAKKKIDRISKQIEECREYDQVVAHLANEKISIDLDDGVKVNYAKFQDVKVINSKGKEVKMNLLSKI